MPVHEVIQALRQGWFFRLPGEPSVYWNPGVDNCWQFYYHLFRP
jgi:hypothetical protein